MRFIIFFYITLICSSASAAKFQREITEIRIYDDHVRVNIGVTYGTCKDSSGNEWWGWSITSPSHQAWLSLILTAKVTGKRLTFYDQQSSCAGPSTNLIGLEGLFLSE